MRPHSLAVFALLGVLGSAAGAATPTCEHVYQSGPHQPTTCKIAVADGWYLTPGLARRKPDGRVASVTKDDPAVFTAVTVTGLTGAAAIALRGGADDPEARFYKDATLRQPQHMGASADLRLQHSFTAYGGLERRIALKDWRGKRLNLSVPLKDDGGAAFVSVHIAKANGTAIRSDARLNRAGGTWQAHQFVLDVPGDATFLTITVGLAGKGTAWLDSITLKPADRVIPASWSERLEGNTTPAGDYYNSATSPPVPGPFRQDEAER